MIKKRVSQSRFQPPMKKRKRKKKEKEKAKKEINRRKGNSTDEVLCWYSIDKHFSKRRDTCNSWSPLSCVLSLIIDTPFWYRFFFKSNRVNSWWILKNRLVVLCLCIVAVILQRVREIFPEGKRWKEFRFVLVELLLY